MIVKKLLLPPNGSVGVTLNFALIPCVGLNRPSGPVLS